MPPDNRELALRREEQLPAEPIPQYGQPQFLEEETIDLRDYLAVILRRKWTIFAFFMIVVVTVGIYTFKTRPLYKATATIEINSASSRVTPFGNDAQANLINQARYLKTQADILKSRTLATRVIEVLDIENNPEFNRKSSGFSIGAITGFIKSLFPDDKNGETAGLDQEKLKKYTILKTFLDQLNVKAFAKGGRGSYLLEISYESHDPKLAADVVNTLIAEDISFDLERRIQSSKLGHRYLDKQIKKVQAKLEASEERLNRFTKEHDIVFLSQLNKDSEGGRDIETAQLESLNTELNKASSQRIALESQYNQSVKNPDNLPQVVGNTLIQTLKEQLSKTKEKYANLSSVFTPKYPKMKRLRSEIRSIEKQIRKEKRLIIGTIKTRYQTALKKEEILKKALKQQKNKVANLKRTAIDYRILKREVDTNQQIYELILKKSKEMDVEVGIKSSGIHPIDQAVVPLKPFKPKKVLNMLLAVIVGLMGGIFGAFVIEYFDNTFKSPEEVEKNLGLPILGTIPHIVLKKEANRERKFIELEALHAPRSAVAEAFRMIRTSLMLSAAGAPPKCLLVTAPQVGGGKSFISLNLALVYAQMGAKVLLLDCDLRRPRLHRVLEVASNPGLSNFLTGKMDLKTITKPVGEHLDHGLKLDFISSGATPPNPVELLNSNIFSDNLEQLKESYDMIIIDSPPLLGFADPLVLSRVADGTLLVIRNEQTPRPVSRHACDLLYQVGANILGAVVNDIKVRKGSYYYGKYYSYYHYYGKEYSKDRKPELTGRLT